jgi:protein-L-isoaspartate(D-aspartate) O-methyltransferase
MRACSTPLVMVPRDAFVPAAHRALAYADAALPLGHGESMMKPVVEGRVLQALEVQGGEDVLEIGTGSGFLTACLGRLAREVHSIELHPEFADAARARLDTMGLGGNVRIEAADAFAWDTDRRYDAICVTGASMRSRSASCNGCARRPPVRRARRLAGDGSGAGAQRRQRSAYRIVVRNRPALPRGRAPAPQFDF